MLYLPFQLDGDRYTLNMARTAEVLPLAATKSVPGMPTWAVGMIERHGAPVSVTDVPQLALGRPAWPLHSTHLVLMRYEVGIRGDGAPLLGLVLEHAMHTRRIDGASLAASGVATPDVHWLGPAANLDDGLVQRVDTEAMLDAHVRTLLSPAAIG